MMMSSDDDFDDDDDDGDDDDHICMMMMMFIDYGNTRQIGRKISVRQLCSRSKKNRNQRFAQLVIIM